MQILLCVIFQAVLLDFHVSVRGKVHGVQGIRGLRFMSEKLVEELRKISENYGI